MKIKSISKQALAVLLSLAVLASTLMLNTLSVFAVDWDGNPAASLKTEEGNTALPGSADNPYLIGSPADLAYLGNLVATGGDTTGKYYQLTADIALNNTVVESGNWYDETNNPIQWTYGSTSDGYAFAGTLDGDGHIIKGLYIRSSTNRYMGLFSKLSGSATIKNLGVEDSYLNNTYLRPSDSAGVGDTGVFAGVINNAADTNVTIENCYVADTVTVISNEYAGGFIGDGTVAVGRKVNIKNCYSSASLTSTRGQSTAAFVAFYYASHAGLNLKNCYSTQGGKTLVGGYSWPQSQSPSTEFDGLFVNCYSLQNQNYVIGKDESNNNIYANFSGLTVITADKMMGKGTTATMANLFTGAGDGAWVALAGYTPQLKVFRKTDKAWDGTFYSVPALLNPTSANSETNPYLISCAAELAYVGEQAKNAQTAGKYYKLTDDIVLNNTEVDSGNWYDDTYNPIQWPYSGTGTAFAGTLDGDGHVIKGVYVNTTASVAGLFDTVNGATIKNLGIESSYYMSTNFYYPWVHYSSSVGAFAGKTWGGRTQSTFNNCYVADTVLNGWDVGGFVGGVNGADTIIMTDCYSSVSIGLPPAKTDDELIAGGATDDDGNAKTEARNNTKGAFLGTGGGGATFTRCYSVDSYQYVGYIGSSPISTTGCYGLNSASGVTVVSLDNMKGRVTTTTMSGLFSEGENSAWVALVGETPKLKVFNPTENTEWDGTFYSVPALLNPTSPNGETNPYLISCAAELAYLGNLVATGGGTTGKYYKLTADIALNDTTNEGWKDSTPNEWTYGKSGKGFYGTLDGAGHVIKGLYVSETSTQTSQATRYASLFSKMGGNGTIKNLGIEDSYFVGNLVWQSGDTTYNIGNAAAFVGVLENNANTKGSIENCYVADSVTVIANEHAGGIIADGTVPDGSEFEIINCYSAANISGTARFKGSVVGFWYGSKALKIKNVYATQSGMPICRIDSTTTEHAKNKAFENCYAVTAQGSGFAGVTVVTSDKMMGRGTTETMSGLFTGAGADAWVALVGKTPQLKVFNPTENTEWDGTFYSAPGLENPAESNSKNNPYLISCASELAYLVKLSSESDATNGKFYKITKDIVINNTANENWKTNAIQWNGIKTDYGFQGTLDGDGHVIKGVYIKSEAATVGLFGNIKNATIKNLGMESSYVESAKYSIAPTWQHYGGNVGAFAGQTSGDNCVISNCYVANTVEVVGWEAGAFIGNCTAAATDITDCYSAAVVRLNDQIGNEEEIRTGNHTGAFLGMISNKSITFTRCYSVTSFGYIGYRYNIALNIVDSYAVGGSDGTKLTLDAMKGNSALGNMSALFAEAANGAWYVMTDETPSLMAFADAAKKANLNTKGDLNVDGYVNILDLVRLAQVKAKVDGAVINESNTVMTDAKYSGDPEAALKMYLLVGDWNQVTFQ